MNRRSFVARLLGVAAAAGVPGLAKSAPTIGVDLAKGPDETVLHNARTGQWSVVRSVAEQQRLRNTQVSRLLMPPGGISGDCSLMGCEEAIYVRDEELFEELTNPGGRNDQPH